MNETDPIQATAGTDHPHCNHHSAEQLRKLSDEIWTGKEEGRGKICGTLMAAVDDLEELSKENARLKGLLHSAVFALLPFTLEDEINGEIEDDARVMIGMSRTGQFDEFFPDRIGTDIMNVRRVIASIKTPHDHGEMVIAPRPITT